MSNLKSSANCVFSSVHARSVPLALVLIGVIQLFVISAATAAVDSPVVTEAIGGNGVPVTVGSFDNVGSIGYEAREFFVAGKARIYSADEKLTKDGKWQGIHPTDNVAGYKTRVVVYAPIDRTRFNGTVYVEWLNNSGLLDAAPDWVHGHIEIARQGAVYILASAQAIGIATLKAKDPWWVPAIPFAVSDPERYGSLKHPGDSYSYDIYSQIAQAARDGVLLGDLVPQRVIGLGESQSAGRLTTYINGIQSLAGVYDGFLVHSSFGRGPALGFSRFRLVGNTHIRDDLVPVILFQSETDVQRGASYTRQPETQNGMFRLWEVAGTAHFDSYGLDIGVHDTGTGAGEIANLNYLQNPAAVASEGLMQCARGINAGPMHWVYNAALSWINRWVTDGTAPPIAPRLETDQSQVFFTTFLADEHGNTRGGIRTPFVDVPIATLTGSGNRAAEGAPLISAFCDIFGQTIPFSDATLRALYPTNGDFVSKFQAAISQAVQSGFLLADDASLLHDAVEHYQLRSE